MADQLQLQDKLFSIHGKRQLNGFNSVEIKLNIGVAGQKSFYGCLSLALGQIVSNSWKKPVNGFESVELELNIGSQPANRAFVAVSLQLEDEYFPIAGKRQLNGFNSLDLKLNNGLQPAKRALSRLVYSTKAIHISLAG